MSVRKVPSAPKEWLVTDRPAADHVAWSNQGGFLFASPVWAQLAASLGAVPLFAWSSKRGVGVLVPVFRRMGMRIGFFGFPVAGVPWDDSPYADTEAAAQQIARAADLSLIRTTRSREQSFDTRAVSARPEAWIDDMAAWSSRNRKRLRKDLAYADRLRNGLEVVRGCSDSGVCFDLYAAAVKARSGRIRYTRSYFERLRAVSECCDRLQIFSAIDADGTIRGFGVLAMHGSVGYYLHGAVDAAGKRQGISDLLLETMVASAHAAGCTAFTHMASPWDQPGLVKFKEKWGDSQGLSVTYDLAAGPIGRCVKLVARWQSRRDRLAASTSGAGPGHKER